MENIKNFIKKYKAEILIVLAAVTSICTTLASEGANGVATSLIIAIVAVLVEVLKNGASEQAILLLAKAIELIINTLKKDKVVSVSLTKEDGTVEDISLDDIKEKLEDALK